MFLVFLHAIARVFWAFLIRVLGDGMDGSAVSNLAFGVDGRGSSCFMADLLGSSD